jgi:predicted RND superfamily exporter protein
LLAALSLIYAQGRLRFNNDRTRMLEPDHPAQRHFEEYRHHFGAHPEMVVLVTCSDTPLRQRAVDDLLKSLREEPGLEGLSAVLEMPLLPQQGLYYLKPEALDQLEQRLWDGHSPRPEDAAVTEQLLQALRSRGREPYQSPFGPSPPPLSGKIYLQMTPHTAVIVASVPHGDERLMDRLRQRVDQEGPRHPGVRLQLGGDFVGLCDDGRAARRTALQVSLISLILVHSFFRWAFGRPQPARMALVTVLVGLAWSCAWAAWSTPQLNMITINFCATLIGLGMDFNVQMLYRYQEERQQKNTDAALRTTLATVGRENLVGALATSAAFFSLTATPFVGVAQLGRISGVGVLLCWLASVTVLPCLIALFDLAAGTVQGPWERWEQGWRGHPRTVLGCVLLITAVTAFHLPKTRFDYNLLNMMPERAAAIQIDRDFHQTCGACSLYAVSLCAGESEMRRRAERFRQLPGVARVECPGDWIPDQAEQRRPQVERILATVRGFRPLPKVSERLSTADLLQLRERFQSGNPQVKAVLRELGPGPIQDGLSYFYNQLYRDLETRIGWLRSQRSQPVPGWSQLPPALLARYRHQDTWLLKIYGRGEMWEREPLRQFLREVRSVDPAVTGLGTLTDTYLEQMQNSYWVAGRNALLAIALILLISFRRPDRALWALAPKLLGAVWMLGLMGLLDLPFNPANATALPLTLGIGLVFGVHVVHQRLHDGRGVFAGSTGSAVLVSGVSTLLGYISLLTSPYRGVASLGLVMALGIGSSLIASLVVLPVVLDVIAKVRTR